MEVAARAGSANRARRPEPAVAGQRQRTRGLARSWPLGPCDCSRPGRTLAQNRPRRAPPSSVGRRVTMTARDGRGSVQRPSTGKLWRTHRRAGSRRGCTNHPGSVVLGGRAAIGARIGRKGGFLSRRDSPTVVSTARDPCWNPRSRARGGSGREQYRPPIPTFLSPARHGFSSDALRGVRCCSWRRPVLATTTAVGWTTRQTRAFRGLGCRGLRRI